MFCQPFWIPLPFLCAFLHLCASSSESAPYGSPWRPALELQGSLHQHTKAKNAGECVSPKWLLANKWLEKDHKSPVPLCQAKNNSGTYATLLSSPKGLGSSYLPWDFAWMHTFAWCLSLLPFYSPLFPTPFFWEASLINHLDINPNLKNIHFWGIWQWKCFLSF